jgi:hypothetical protein
MIFKKDDLRLGLILGLFGPVVGLLVIYFLKFSSFSFADFLSEFTSKKNLTTSVGALCLLANAVLFTLYINTHRDNTAKGIFLTTVIYGIGILVLKII